MDCAEKVARGLVVAGGDGTVLLESAIGRNDNALAGLLQGRDHPLLGIVGFVGDDRIRRNVGQQNVRPVQIVGLPRREVKSGRIAQGIGGGMDLGAQSTTAASDGLVFRAPFFAPALC